MFSLVACVFSYAYIFDSLLKLRKHDFLFMFLGQLRGSLPVMAVPSSSIDLFAKLLSKLESTLPSSKIQELQPLFAAYKVT